MHLLAWMGTRGSVVSALALFAGALVAAWIGIAQVEAGRLQPDQPSEVSERENLKQAVQSLFDKSDYAALERLADYFRSSGARTGSGVWKLTVFYRAFHDITGAIDPNDDKDWRVFSDKIGAWQGRFAGKPTAFVVQAIALKSFAWSLRPRTFVMEASTGSEAKFMAALGNARDALDRNRAMASADPHYYVLRADMATILGEAPDQVMALIGEGRTRFPDYFALDFSGLDYFAVGTGDKAIGQAEAARIEAFASTATAQALPELAAERYARLYWHAYQAVYGNDLFHASRVDWPRMRTGLADIVARYPDAWNVHSFAYFACLAGDRETTRRLLGNVAGRPPMEIWQSRAIFGECRHWASLEPAEMRR